MLRIAKYFIFTFSFLLLSFEIEFFLAESNLYKQMQTHICYFLKYNWV